MNRYFSMDGEFSGLDHTKYDLVSIGLIEIIKEDKYIVDYNRKFYLELKPQHNHFDKEAMEINGLSFANLYQYGSEPKEACRQIIKYLDLKKDDTAIFIGYCNTLDKIYTDQLFLLAGVKNPFHYETIEISSIAIGKLGFEWGFSENELENKLGINKMSGNKKHDAQEDAIHQAEEFCSLMNYNEL